jgi:hypothetical protein
MIGRHYFARQAAIVLKFAEWTTNPEGTFVGQTRT